jgi:membrane protein DedA with SNARE-associated domain
MVLSEIVAHLTALLRAGGPWLGPILAGAAFAEALVMIGVFVPVTPALLAIGAAVAGHMMGPWLLVWVMGGAFLGNAASYELGRSLQARGVAAPRMPAKARAVAQDLFLRHGAVAIVVARFLGPPATVAPFLAGWSRLPRGRFLAASAVASLLWPLATAAVGFVGVWLLRR